MVACLSNLPANAPSVGLQLRTGLVYENQFLMALNAAGINKHISPDLLQQ